MDVNLVFPIFDSMHFGFFFCDIVSIFMYLNMVIHYECIMSHMTKCVFINFVISSHLSPLTSKVVGAPQMTLQQTYNLVI